MTELSVGALFGTVELVTTPFDRGYARVVAKMEQLGQLASSAGAKTTTLDRGLAAVGAAGDKASVSLGRAAKVTADNAAAEQKAATAAQRHAAALDEVAVVMGDLAGLTAREQRAALGLIGAHERLAAVERSETATVRQLAAAQAGLIGAEDRLTAAQNAAATAAEREAAAMRAAALSTRAASTEAVVAGGRFSGAFAGMGKTAAELGLVVGAVEVIKKAIDITKEANEFQRSMVQVQTNADVSAAEVNKASSALLAMAGPVAAAPSELATAWYHAKSVGLDYAKSIEVTRIAAEGARVGNADLEQTMNALTSTVASGISGVQDMSGAMGQLIAVVGSGDMKLSDLNDFLGSGILTRMKQYGLTLTDVGAAAATLGDNNIRGADAATLLRMAVEAMVKQGTPGQTALEGIGIKVNQLRDDIQRGGLNKALLDLNAHLKTAGVTGDKVGSFLLDAFTKKGGGGVSILLGQLDRFESKLAILRNSSASFDDKWQATKATASFALASIGHAAEAAGIELTEKLGPSIAAIVNALGTQLPRALAPIAKDIGSTIGNVWYIVAPFVKTIGVGLAVAFGVAAKAAQVLADAVSGVAQFLRDNAGVVRVLVGAFLAFRAAAIAASVAQLALNAAMEINPVVALTTAVLALGWAYKTLGGYAGTVDKLGNAWDVISGKTGHVVGISKDANAVFDQGAHVIGDATGAAIAYVSATGKVDKILTLTTDSQKRYAAMAGLVADKNGKVAGSGNAARAAIAGMADQEATATQATAQLLTALDSFSKSAGTSADRAALIGAVLKAGNGDALQYATTMNGAAQAEKGLADAVMQVTGAKSRGDAANAKYLAGVVNLRTGTINYAKANAGPLLSALGQVQSAGLAAAQAAFQHARATMSGKDAADAAYKVYKSETGPQLVSTLKSLGLNTDQAQKLAEKYLGMPKNVKTLIEQAGADPIVTVLKQIRGLLAELTGHPWAPKVTADASGATKAIENAHQKWVDSASQIARLQPILNVDVAHAGDQMDWVYDRWNRLQSKTIVLTTIVNNAGTRTGTSGGAQPIASGGPMRDGWSTVGEGGPGARPELVHKSGSNVTVVSNAKAAGVAAALGLNAPGLRPGGVPVPAFAAGTGDSSALRMVMAAIFNAIRPGAASLPGQVGMFAGDRAQAVRDRQAALAAHAAYDSAHQQEQADAKHLKALQGAAKQDDKAIAAAQKAADASAAAAQKAKTAWDGTAQTAQASAQAAAEAAATIVSTLQSKVESFSGQVGDFRSSVSSGLSGGTSLTSLYSDTGGDATAMQARAKAILTNEKLFGSDLRAMARIGYSAAEIQEVAGLGATSGDALAKQLIALGPKYAAKLNKTLDAINNVAGANTNVLSKGFFSEGQKSIDSVIAGIEKKYPELRKALGPIQADLAAMFHFTPVVTAPHYTGGHPSGHLPGHAMGGMNLAGGWSIVGERGPEIEWTPPHSNIYRNGQIPIVRSDMDNRMADKLDAIERRLASIDENAPGRFGQAVAQPLRAAALVGAREDTRIGRSKLGTRG